MSQRITLALTRPELFEPAVIRRLETFCELRPYEFGAGTLDVDALWVDPLDDYLGCGHAHLFPSLRWILTNTTDTGHVDRLAGALGLQPISLQGCDLQHVRSTAEYTALLIQLALRPASRTLEPGRLLEGASVVIVGVHEGRIGRVAGQLGYFLSEQATLVNRGGRGPSWVIIPPALLPHYAPQADVVSLNLPALPQYRHLIDAEQLAGFNRRAALVNTSRASLVDMGAVVKALDAGRLQRYVTDFLTGLEHPRIWQSDHVAGFTREDLARTQMLLAAKWQTEILRRDVVRLCEAAKNDLGAMRAAG